MSDERVILFGFLGIGIGLVLIGVSFVLALVVAEWMDADPSLLFIGIQLVWLVIAVGVLVTGVLG